MPLRGETFGCDDARGVLGIIWLSLSFSHISERCYRQMHCLCCVHLKTSPDLLLSAERVRMVMLAEQWWVK